MPILSTRSFPSCRCRPVACRLGGRHLIAGLAGRCPTCRGRHAVALCARRDARTLAQARPPTPCVSSSDVPTNSSRIDDALAWLVPRDSNNQPLLIRGDPLSLFVCLSVSGVCLLCHSFSFSRLTPLSCCPFSVPISTTPSSVVSCLFVSRVPSSSPLQMAHRAGDTDRCTPRQAAHPAQVHSLLAASAAETHVSRVATMCVAWGARGAWREQDRDEQRVCLHVAISSIVMFSLLLLLSLHACIR